MMNLPHSLQSKSIDVDGLSLHYLEAGEGEPILLLHGWPTSSYLWRNVMPPMAKSNRVIALDLPAFGLSSKNPADSYSFFYYEQVIEGFLKALGIEQIGLAVHDLGGPIGIFWALRHPEKLTSLALLNTLVYPEVSWMVKLFVAASITPGVRWWLSSPAGLSWAMRFGVVNKQNISAEVARDYYAPFATSDARNALLRTASRLSPKGFKEIKENLSSLTIPLRIIYGENDRILPKVGQTMAKVKRDLPQAEITPLPNCGHFLQEDDPEQIGDLLATFFNSINGGQSDA